MSEKEKTLATDYFKDAIHSESQQPEGEILQLNILPEEGVTGGPMELPDVDHEVLEFMPEDLSDAVPEGAEEGEAYVVSFSEDDFMEDEVTFTEEELMEEEVMPGPEFSEEITFEEDMDDLTDLDQEIDQSIQELEEDLGEGSSEPAEAPVEGGRYLPGSSEPIFDDKPEEDPEEEYDTNWQDDRDTSKFIDYLRDGYANIPKHNGNSISGCERALAFLNKLNREISEAVRRDEDNALDPVLDEVEDFRVKILQGMVALKNRVGELKKKFKEEGSQKRAGEDVKQMVKESLESKDGLTKEAKSGKLQVVITPFERAVTGILINSVVSAGHPFEEVYDYLKKKFNLTAREELAVLQIVMDMGYPIFKDRGTIGESGDGEQEGHGVDFVKNYFG